MSQKFGCILLMLSWVSIRANSQSVTVPDSSILIFAGLSFHAGKYIPFTFGGHPKSTPLAIQVDLRFMKNTERSWSQCNCYGSTGLSINYLDFKFSEKLGRAINTTVFAEPYLYYSPRFQVLLRGGLGLSFLDKVYDSLTNPFSYFFSKHISFAVHLGASANFRINSMFNARLSAQLTHMSNGNTRYPNYGITLPTLAVGLDYNLTNRPIIKRKGLSQSKFPFYLAVQLIAGKHLEQGKERLVTATNIGFIKQLSRFYAIGAGGEIEYDPINEIYVDRIGNRTDRTLVAYLGAHQYFIYKRLLVGYQFLYYAIPRNPDLAFRVHHMYSVQYHFTRHFYGGIQLKTHYDIADYLVFSVGKWIRLK